MSLTPEDKLLVLQRFVNNFQQDLLAVHAALGHAGTPDAAKRFLIGGLNYGMDMLDMYPDHNKGIGIADDAIVLRLASKLARAAGATDPGVDTLATDANLVLAMFENLAGPLEKMVAGFPDREVRGRTADKILSHKDTRIMFDADIGREAKRHTPQSLGEGTAATRQIVELEKMFEHALKRANLM
jgi:uncharacterized membrane protein YkvA (DUF1232 family)